MFDELLDIFERDRDRKSGGAPRPKGIRGWLTRIAGAGSDDAPQPSGGRDEGSRRVHHEGERRHRRDRDDFTGFDD